MFARILVGYHCPSEIISGSLFFPIHLGRALAMAKVDYKYENEWMFRNTFGDDTGENISKKNETYNELTGIYWAWKNFQKLGNPEYIGFAHYRRYPILKGDLKPEGDRWTVDFDRFNEEPLDFMEKLGYTEDNLRQIFTDYDYIATSIDLNLTVWEQYKAAENLDFHYLSDLEQSCTIVKTIFPEFSEAVNLYINGRRHYYGNMFVLPQKLFFRYCEFIFTILQEFEKKVSLQGRSCYSKRFFISERLTGIFFKKLELEGLKCKNVYSSFIRNTKPRYEIIDRKENKNQSINLVFAVDKNYLQYLNVSLYSLIEHISGKYQYNIFVLHEGLSDSETHDFVRMLNLKPNVRLEFIDVSSYMARIKDHLYIEIHVTRSTYYRFLVQEIFEGMPRILYLDTDLIFLRDVAELYFSNLQGYPLAAVPDVRERFAAQIDFVLSNGVHWRDYVTNILNVENYNQYFQAGVLLFDLENLEKSKISLKECCLSELRRIKRPILSDQDILNSAFYNKVHFLPVAWNVEWQIPFEFDQLHKRMEESLYRQYSHAYKYPNIMHYASSVKPWIDMEKAKADLWWEYARKSPYYERMLLAMLRRNVYIHQKSCLSLRKIVIGLLPSGTIRGRVARKLYHWIR